MIVSYADDDRDMDGLKAEIRHYLDGSGMPRRGDREIKLRSWVLLGAWMAIYALLVFAPAGPAVSLAAALLGGVVSAALVVAGHNALHGMLGESPVLQRLLAVMLSAHGFDRHWWHIKHHRLHHRFPNVFGVDDDLEHSGLIRMSPEAPLHGWHRFQHLYAWFLYPLTHLGMVLVGDPRFLITGTMSGQQFGRGGFPRVARWLLGKCFALVVLLLMPAWMHGWAAVIPLFLVWSLTTGLVLAALFVCTHTVIGTRYPKPGEDGSLSRSRTYMSVVGSADVGIDSPLVNWLFAGVTAHTAHHLYPGISATHYPPIARIIRSFCVDRGIPYTGFAGFGAALLAHYRYLKSLGRPAQVGDPEICPA